MGLIYGNQFIDYLKLECDSNDTSKPFSSRVTLIYQNGETAILYFLELFIAMTDESPIN